MSAWVLALNLALAFLGAFHVGVFLGRTVKRVFSRRRAFVDRVPVVGYLNEAGCAECGVSEPGMAVGGRCLDCGGELLPSAEAARRHFESMPL